MFNAFSIVLGLQQCRRREPFDFRHSELLVWYCPLGKGAGQVRILFCFKNLVSRVILFTDSNVMPAKPHISVPKTQAAGFLQCNAGNGY